MKSLDLFDGAATSGQSAIISECGQYRYRLTREWDTTRHRMLWIMLNPSTADAGTDDPTIRRCTGFAKSWGYDGFDVVNLFALRSTDPSALRDESRDPVGEATTEHILNAIPPGEQYVVCAWGNWGHLRDRDKVVLKLLVNAGVKPRALRIGATGQPGHPLYLPSRLSPGYVWDGKGWVEG